MNNYSFFATLSPALARNSGFRRLPSALRPLPSALRSPTSDLGTSKRVAASPTGDNADPARDRLRPQRACRAPGWFSPGPYSTRERPLARAGSLLNTGRRLAPRAPENSAILQRGWKTLNACEVTTYDFSITRKSNKTHPKRGVLSVRFGRFSSPIENRPLRHWPFALALSRDQPFSPFHI